MTAKAQFLLGFFVPATNTPCKHDYRYSLICSINPHTAFNFSKGNGYDAS